MKTRMFAYIIGVALAAGCNETTTVPIPDGEGDLHRQVGSVRADWPKGFSPYGVHARRGRGRLCERGPHRQFDFWLGHYDLVNPDGTTAVEREVGECLITEEFTGTGGIRGRSLNAYDRPEFPEDADYLIAEYVTVPRTWQTVRLHIRRPIVRDRGVCRKR